MGLYPKREPVSGGRESKPVRAHQTDVAQFSRGSVASLEKALMGAKASIQSAVAAPPDPARLEALTQRLNEGSYHVGTDELVRAFLDLDA
ncbi:MAG: hypothetical protein FWE32_06430 [Oscillospiraceae bacterium]|nr:hypothetical protein [Oscillospiraceae bacterium]